MNFGAHFRAFSLVLPSVLAWYVAFSAPHKSALVDAVRFGLAPLWLLLAVALLVRGVEGVLWRRGRGGRSFLARVDVLTASGALFSWSCAFAIMGSVWLGWASLGAVGLMGTGVLHFVALAALVSIRGEDPIRRASVTRRFVPETASEGETVIEELRFDAPRIPVGFRLFASGRVGPRWSTTRYALDASESGAEIVLESDLGAAVRGEHDAEPLELWLQDVFGFCRSPQIFAAPARLVVLPRPYALENGKPLLDRGLGAREPRAASRLPTEGSFRLREYQPGDDVRRIHWIRSQAARQIVVRTPDELPPDQPRVRLVLDTYSVGATDLLCDAPAELLDALVCVWLAVGRALAESDVQVVLVTAASDGTKIAKTLQSLRVRSLEQALRLGARVRWQESLAVDSLLTDEATIVISTRPPPAASGEPGCTEHQWIVVPSGYACTTPRWEASTVARLPFPMGSSENGGAERRKARRHAEQARVDYRLFADLCAQLGPLPEGCIIAVPARGTIRLEAAR